MAPDELDGAHVGVEVHAKDGVRHGCTACTGPGNSADSSASAEYVSEPIMIGVPCFSKCCTSARAVQAKHASKKYRDESKWLTVILHVTPLHLHNVLALHWKLVLRCEDVSGWSGPRRSDAPCTTPPTPSPAPSNQSTAWSPQRLAACLQSSQVSVVCPWRKKIEVRKAVALWYTCWISVCDGGALLV